MTRICISRDESEAAVARVQAVLDEVALRDPSWNGANFEIARDDRTYVDAEGYAAAALFIRVCDALRGEEEETC
jgi:hypothetical protein